MNDLLDLYSKVLKVDVASLYDDSPKTSYLIQVNTFDFGFKLEIFLFYPERDLMLQKDLTIKKVQLLKEIAKFYNTEVLADFPFRSNILHPAHYDGDFYTDGEFFLFDSKGACFYVQEEPYPIKKISKETGYTEKELSNYSIGIIPAFRSKINEEALIYEINNYFDNKIS